MLCHLMLLLVEIATASAITSEMASVHSSETSSASSSFEAKPTVNYIIKGSKNWRKVDIFFYKLIIVL